MLDDLKPLEKWLAQLDILAALPASALAELGSACRLFNVAPATTVLDAMSPREHGVFVLFEGRAAIKLPEPEPSRQITELAAVSSFGEFGVLFGKPGSASVSSISHCKLGEIAPDVFRGVMECQPQLPLALLQRTIRDFRSLNLDATPHLFDDRIGQDLRRQLAIWSL